MSFRKEYKFRLSKTEFYRFQNHLQKNGMIELFEPRRINSVYFDTPQLDMFFHSEEGLVPRKKIRVRWYDNDVKFHKEIKTSSVEGRHKKSYYLPELNTVEDLLTNTYFDQQYGKLYPVVKISYLRSYFKFQSMRVTFDEKITYNYLKNEMKRTFVDPELVSEIKTSIHCSDEFIGKHLPYPSARFSKYSRAILFSQAGLNEM